MGPDVALGERAVERVGERVQRRRRRPNDPLSAAEWGMRTPHEPYMVAGREGVDVEALADPASRPRSPMSRASAALKSCMVVTLTLAGSPSNT